MGFQSYRDLKVWQRSLDLVDAVYEIVGTFPVDERFAMANQMIRAAVSIPANLAEGCGSGYRQQFLKHIGIARGSLAELETYLEIGLRRKYISGETCKRIHSICDEVSRMTSGLRSSLKRKDPPAK